MLRKGEKGRKFPGRRPDPSNRGPREEESDHRQEAADTPQLRASNDSPTKLTKGQWGPNRALFWVMCDADDAGFPPAHVAARAVLRAPSA